jgi:hypothetical protein
MPGLIDISINESQFDELVDLLGNNQARRAALSALNKTISFGNTEIKRRVKATLNLKPSAINSAITVHKAKYEDLRAWITVSKRLVSLYDFKGTTYSKSRGVSVQMRLDRPRSIFRHAFAAEAKSQQQRAAVASGLMDHFHVGIFSREKGRDKGGRLTKKGYGRRLPIAELLGPSVLDLFGEDATTQLATEELAKLQDKLAENIESQIDRFLNRKKSDRPQ